jgi:hypothetical protein
MARLAVLALLGVSGTVLALAACGDDGATSAPVRTKGESARKPQVCFKAEPLQVNGGKGLAAIDQENQGGPPVANVNLGSIARGTFGLNLRWELKHLERRAGEESMQVVASAGKALKKVEAEPELLLKEAELEDTFANAQRLAEAGGFSSPRCGS